MKIKIDLFFDAATIEREEGKS